MNNCFVYGFFDPRENFKEFFYIGKGKNDRLKSLSRNHFVNERIKEIRNSGSNVEIILFEENLTDDEAFELEKKLIKLYGRKIFNEGSLLNIMPGGEGIIGFCGELNGFYNKKHTPETLKGKMSGENNPMFGYEFSEEQLLKKSEISKNLWKDEEFRKKNILSRTGLKRTKETCENISKGNKDKNKGKKFMVKDGVSEVLNQKTLKNF